MAEGLGLAVGVDQLGPEVGLGQVLGLGQLRGIDAVGDHVGQHRVELGDGLGGAVAAGAGHRHAVQRRIAERRELDVDGRYQLALDHQAAVQARRRAAGEQRGGQLERRPVGVALADGAPAEQHAITRDRSRRRLVARGGGRRLDDLDRRRQRRRRQRAVRGGDLREQIGLVDRADHHQRGVVGRVPGPVEAADVVDAHRADVGHPADRRPAVRVEIERGRHQLLVEPAVDVVLDALAPLVGHDIALGLDRRRLEHQAVHALALEADRQRQLVGRHAEAVVGPVDPGRGVGLAAGRLDHAIELAGRQRLGLAEHQVLEQVREAGLARLLVARADAEPGLERHDGHRRIDRAHHAETVVEPPPAHRESADRSFRLEAHARWCRSHRTVLPGSRRDAAIARAIRSIRTRAAPRRDRASNRARAHPRAAGWASSRRDRRARRWRARGRGG